MLIAKKCVRKLFFLSCQILFLSSLLHPAFAAETTATPQAPLSNEFPASLEATQDTNISTTPEYVILRPSEQVTFSSETTASVATINVKEGSVFQTGDILLTLDCRIQNAELKKANAQMEAANFAYKSAQKLKSYGAISGYELVQASTQRQIAKADVDKLGTIVEKCVIKAPFNGAVSGLLVDTHDTVKPGDPLLKIVNTQNLTFELQVPSAWLSWLHINSTFYVLINETKKLIPAKIAKINPEIDSVSQTVKVVGEISKPDSSLRPGMSGQAQFPDNPVQKT